MTATPTLKIDGYAHISPARYTEALRREFPGFYKQILGITPPLFDMETRFKVMDAFAPIAQVLTVGPVPPLEHFADPARAAALARLANDEMAELIAKYPDRFVAAIALLPMNDVAGGSRRDRPGHQGAGIQRHLRSQQHQRQAPRCAGVSAPLREDGAYDLPIYIHPVAGQRFRRSMRPRTSRSTPSPAPSAGRTRPPRP